MAQPEPSLLDADGPCPYCERAVPTRLVRLDWPNPVAPDDSYAYMCRACDGIWRKVIRDFGITYIRDDGASKLTLRHAPTLAMRRAARIAA